MDPWGEEDKILLSNDPHPQGPPVLGSPCPPPGNYSSKFQGLVKRKGVIYSKVIQT